MVFGRLSFPRTRLYVVAVWDPQIVRAKKKLGNHCPRGLVNLQLGEWNWLYNFCYRVVSLWQYLQLLDAFGGKFKPQKLDTARRFPPTYRLKQ